MARTRTQDGYVRCHDTLGHDGPHHASDRTWLPLRFASCDCQPDEPLAYLGSAPFVGQKGKPRDGWPTPWHGPAVW